MLRFSQVCIIHFKMNTKWNVCNAGWNNHIIWIRFACATWNRNIQFSVQPNWKNKENIDRRLRSRFIVCYNFEILWYTCAEYTQIQSRKTNWNCIIELMNCAYFWNQTAKNAVVFKKVPWNEKWNGRIRCHVIHSYQLYIRISFQSSNDETWSFTFHIRFIFNISPIWIFDLSRLVVLDYSIWFLKYLNLVSHCGRI